MGKEMTNCQVLILPQVIEEIPSCMVWPPWTLLWTGAMAFDLDAPYVLVLQRRMEVPRWCELVDSSMGKKML